MKERILKESYVEKILGSKPRVRILKLLAKDYELNISAIIKKTRLNHQCALRHLKKLKDLNFIQEKRFGRIRIFRFKTENVKAMSFKRLIQIWDNELEDFL
ncbi:MAG: ArsR family transcriptional regulator [Promethearchaeota archaeon]|nr:MAG: ArsR family transcriptional regulator [Candidatus Lokiarchaeota archaeon]